MKNIIKMIPFHCQRGSRWCAKCKILSDNGLKYCLRDFVGRDEMITCPMMQIGFKGEKV
ncbi:MAG: hypothetical protein ACTSR8_12050 [Promethearchaeota archaeon]